MFSRHPTRKKDEESFKKNVEMSVKQLSQPCHGTPLVRVLVSDRVFCCWLSLHKSQPQDQIPWWARTYWLHVCFLSASMGISVCEYSKISSSRLQEALAICLALNFMKI